MSVRDGASIPCNCGHEREDHFEAGPHGELLICEHDGCDCDQFAAAPAEVEHDPRAIRRRSRGVRVTRRYTLQLTSNWPAEGRTYWLSPERTRDGLSPDLVAYATFEARDKADAMNQAQRAIQGLQHDERNCPKRLARITAPVEWDGTR